MYMKVKIYWCMMKVKIYWCTCAEIKVCCVRLCYDFCEVDKLKKLLNFVL